ncbi:MAG: LytR C-terminal domain-containing protein [Egibacteraceae bacterium]
MGRHAHPDSRSFYRSLSRASVRVGMIALAMVIGVGVVASYALNGPERASTAEQVLAESTTAPAKGQAPNKPAGATARPRQRPQRQDLPPPPVNAQAPDETSVQVLDSVGDPAVTEQVVGVLQDLGYQIAAVNPSVREYKNTTVFHSKGHRPDALALSTRDPRFSEVGTNDSLSQQVDLHVVVGADWRR